MEVSSSGSLFQIKSTWAISHLLGMARAGPIASGLSAKQTDDFFKKLHHGPGRLCRK